MSCYHGCVKVLIYVAVATCADWGCMHASDDRRKVIVSSFVLHASCLETGAGGSSTLNVDDLYSVTLQWRRTAMHG